MRKFIYNTLEVLLFCTIVASSVITLVLLAYHSQGYVSALTEYLIERGI